MTQTVTRVEDLFDSLDRERAEGIRSPMSVSKTLRVEELCQSYKQCMFDNAYSMGAIDLLQDSRMVYNRARQDFGSKGYGSLEITEFMMALPSFIEEHRDLQRLQVTEQGVGSFVSALIDGSPDERFHLPVDHFDRPLSNLGRANRKQVYISGDVGYFLGRYSKEGKIAVTGDANDFCGANMNGGIILVNGSAVDNVGSRLRGGSIYISGNCRHFVGKEMSGGVISIMGSSKDLAGDRMSGGELIIHGDSGKNIGFKNNGGSITVKGSVDGRVGIEMTDGDIRVHGRSFEVSRKYRNGMIYHKDRVKAKGGTIV